MIWKSLHKSRQSPVGWHLLVLVIFLTSIPLLGSTYDEALQALDDNLPQVAVYKLTASLTAAKSDEEKIKYGNSLARALLESNRPTQAIDVLNSLPKSDNDEGQFWMARALYAKGDMAEALKGFSAIAANSKSPWNGPARIGKATCLRQEGKVHEALADLIPLPSDKASHNAASLLAAEIFIDEKQSEKAKDILHQIQSPTDAQSDLNDYLQAQIQFEQGHLVEAAEQFGRIARQAGGIDPRLSISAVEWGAKTFLLMNDIGSAEQFLESFIQDHPQMPGLAQVFGILDSVYQLQSDPSLTVIKKWAGEREGERAILAAFYRARLEARVGSQQRAEQFYREFLTNHPRHDYVFEAQRELAQLLLTRNDPQGALAILEEKTQTDISPSPAIKARIDFERGEALAKLGRYSEATQMFQEAAHSTALQSAAIENATRTMLRSQTRGTKLAVQPESYSLETALELARLHDPLAQEALSWIVAHGSPSDAEHAQLALLEQEWERGNRSRTSDWLITRVANEGKYPEVDERADFLALMLTDDDSPGADERVTAEAQKYLTKHPDGPRKGEVRFKLGEILFRKGDYRASRIQFLDAAKFSQNDALREQSLFLAGLSAARSISPGSLTSAIEHFETVAALKGSLAAEARLEEALVKNALGESNDALVIIDKALAADTDGRIHWRALTTKGDTLLSIAGSDPEKLQKAADVFQSMASDPKAPLRWRNEGFCKLGIVRAKMGDRDGALTAYYDVLNAPQGEVPEFFWYYKAGFEAGQMLENQQQWKEAISVYEKMARLQGPRSDEAQAQINRLRLENFIWEE